MKDPKLLIPVHCTTRKIYLQPPPRGRNDWHVRFVPPGIDGKGQEIFRSTGTKEIAAAKWIAAITAGLTVAKRCDPRQLKRTLEGDRKATDTVLGIRR